MTDPTVSPILLRYRPLTVEAMQVTVGNEKDVAAWARGCAQGGVGVWVLTNTGTPAVARYGEWVIKGAFGDFYPVPDSVRFGAFERPVTVVSE